MEKLLDAFLEDRNRALRAKNAAAREDFFYMWGEELVLLFRQGQWEIVLRGESVLISVDLVIRLISTPLIAPQAEESFCQWQTIYEDKNVKDGFPIFCNDQFVATAHAATFSFPASFPVVSMADSDTTEAPSKDADEKPLKPQKFDSCQDYLKALGYTENGENFTKGDHKVPFSSLAKNTPATLAEKMRREIDQ